MPIFNSLPHSAQQGSRGVFLGYRPFINTVNFSSDPINEGSTLTFSVYTLEVSNYDTVSYEITGISPDDVVGGSSALSGTFQVFNNQSITEPSVTFVSDFTLEGDETLTITFTLNSRKEHTEQVTVADLSRPTFQIATHPNNANIVYFASNSSIFTTVISPINSGSGNVSYQWQRSTNMGTTWSNLVSNSQFSNVTASSLAIEAWSADISSNFNGAYFRCRITDNDNNYTLTTTAASLTVSNGPYGAATFTTPGNTTWTVPSNVYAISAVLVGGGGGGGYSILNPNAPDARVGAGGGGGATYASPIIKVVPGETVTLTVGAGGNGAITSSSYTVSSNATAGGNTRIYFDSQPSLPYMGWANAGGGSPGQQFTWEAYVNGNWNYPKAGQVFTVSSGVGGSVTSSGISNRYIGTALTGSGGRGGVGQVKGVAFRYTASDSRGGGGAGGYGAAGGAASYAATTGSGSAGGNGGGGGGSGAGSNTTSANGLPTTTLNAGGGVGIFGEGSNGAGGTLPTSPSGKGGSGGANGTLGGGGLYGGGGQARQREAGYTTGGSGAQGAIRIVFGTAPNGNVRSYAANNDTANTANTTVY